MIGVDTGIRFMPRPDCNVVNMPNIITFTYEMTGSEIVRWDSSNIDAGANGYNLTLATCWPLDGKLSGPMRYVVHARLKPTAMFGDSQRIARARFY